jgi:4-hydroxy-L-threonine phosphate dehydrogenase PdxA
MARVAVTLGDQAGIGPEVIAKLLSNLKNLQRVDIVLLADQEELAAAESQAGVKVPHSLSYEPGKVLLIPDGNSNPNIPLGQVSIEAGVRVISQLSRALELAKSGEADAILFGPLNKTSLKMGGMDHEDELRWFATELGHQGFTSELNILESMTTARVTSHIPISEVAKNIDQSRVVKAIELLQETLVTAGKAAPRIGVCALNPHAGENGNFGREEIDIIAPAIELVASRGLNVQGPFPSDTIFATKRHLFDGIVTMYHDQGQIAMKLIGFDTGVTVQGGLPISIATPAHGTAFDIVGQGRAGMGATEHAFEYSVRAAIAQALKGSAD